MSADVGHYLGIIYEKVASIEDILRSSRDPAQAVAFAEGPERIAVRAFKDPFIAAREASVMKDLRSGGSRKQRAHRKYRSTKNMRSRKTKKTKSRH